MGSALLVMDIKEEYFNEKNAYLFEKQRDAELLNACQKTFMTVNNYITTVNRIMRDEKRKGTKIIYVYETSSFFKNLFLYMSNGKRRKERDKLHKRLSSVGEITFIKYLPDAFSSRKLINYLRENNVNEIKIIGVDSTRSAFYTAKSGIKKGFQITMLSDGLLTFHPEDAIKCEITLKVLGVCYK